MGVVSLWGLRITFFDFLGANPLCNYRIPKYIKTNF